MYYIKNFGNYKNSFLLAILLFVIAFTAPSVFAQSIPITKSPSMDQVVFDGKWTFMREWKESSLTYIETELNNIFLRTAHQQNYIYLMIDAVPDKTLNKGQDQVVVCFDANSEQNISPDENDYCFLVKLGERTAITLRGSELGRFEIIQNHPDLIAIGGVSDDNDRYSKIPHTSYEFRIPIDLLGRTDSYGFYVGVFEHNNSTMYTWPSNLSVTSKNDIPNPNEWGIIFSPDKSLPEYELPMLILIMSIVMVIFVSSKISRLNLPLQNR